MGYASTKYIRKPYCFSCGKNLSSHYSKWCKPCHAKKRTIPVKNRLYKFIKKTDKCWEWTGAKDHNGYGRFHNKGGTSLSHKIVWEIEHGKIAKGMSLCHACDNPPCCRPSHLFVGTQLENGIDASLKGRNNGVRRLTEAEVIEIRRTYIPYKRGVGPRSLAIKYGVTHNAIRCIVKGETWKHLL